MKENEEQPEYAIEYRYGSKWNERPESLYRFMECKVCGQMSKASEETTSITCSDCVMDMWEPLASNYIKSDRPRGWTLMSEFVDKDGNVFHRGIEQSDLKGKIEPTVVEKTTKKSKRMTKREKTELIATAAINLHKLKKQLQIARWKKDKKIILSEIKYHTKIATSKFPRTFNREEYLLKYKKS
jgi:transketolase